MTNLASRLAACATGGTILVSVETAGRIRAHVPLQAMGKRYVKGIEAAVPVYRVLWQEGDNARD